MNFKNIPCWVRVASVVLVAVFLLNWPADSGQWAAWVQALGSVLALIVAIRLSEQERLTRRQERDQDRSEQAHAAAYDMTTLTVELHGHIVQLHAYSAGNQDRSLYLAEVLFFKNFQQRLTRCTSGSVPTMQKNLGLEVRKLALAVTEYVVARSLGQVPQEPDWITWGESAEGLSRQADMAIPKTNA
ncbi:MAG: hypothetical protein WBF84_06675 [Castellaniella sp.]|uniref:hypothetical protein n=1 Tax=Castellaniella sp. TaxID=1955812 RepID=UPI003C70AA95